MLCLSEPWPVIPPSGTHADAPLEHTGTAQNSSPLLLSEHGVVEAELFALSGESLLTDGSWEREAMEPTVACLGLAGLNTSDARFVTATKSSALSAHFLQSEKNLGIQIYKQYPQCAQKSLYPKLTVHIASYYLPWAIWIPRETRRRRFWHLLPHLQKPHTAGSCLHMAAGSSC